MLFFLFVWVVLLQLHYIRFWSRFRRIIKDTKGDSLEHLLIEHMKSLEMTRREIKKVSAAHEYLEAMTTRSVQKIGLVRFNPFHDTGSNQSFSLALLDLYDNGVVISSIHGREGTRVYAKALQSGRSKHKLSDEEQLAIEQARLNKGGKVDTHENATH
jgi:hypothetical protein